MRGTLVAAGTVAAVLASGGCGGRVTHPAPSVTVDAATDAVTGASGCPAPVVAGGTCAGTPAMCLATDGCNRCACVGGYWVCSTLPCSADDAGACPTVRPASGDACGAASGSSCDYGAGCNGAHCVCAGGHWTCDPLVCVDA